MSERLWDLRWSGWSLDGVTGDVGVFADAKAFIAEHYASIFAGEPGRFLTEAMTPAKLRFLDECDAFLFRAGGQTIAIGLGHPTDWSTYYIRTFALLPAYRDRGIVRALIEGVAADVERVGVERLEFETSPGNVPMNKAFLATGCVVTGTSNTERWGTMLRYTLHLTPEAHRVFERQFLAMPATGKHRQSQP